MSEVRRWTLVGLLAIAAAGVAFAIAPRPGGPDDTPQGSGRCPPGRVRFRGACVPRAACPPGQAPIAGACVRLDAPDAGPLTPPTLVRNAHTEHDGTVTSYDVIPRAFERPERWDSYVYPVPDSDPIVTSGFDLDRPDALQRRGNPNNPVGHGGLDLARPIGVPIASVPLEGQMNPTAVLYVGMLFGQSVVTLHERPDGAFVAIHGHMSAVAPGIEHGATVAPGALLGAVGDSWTPRVPHLHYEVRWVRTGIDPWTLSGRALWDNEKAVPCDPRNVLPFR